jgi:hypothetical protein
MVIAIIEEQALCQSVLAWLMHVGLGIFIA